MAKAYFKVALPTYNKNLPTEEMIFAALSNLWKVRAEEAIGELHVCNWASYKDRESFMAMFNKIADRYKGRDYLHFCLDTQTYKVEGAWIGVCSYVAISTELDWAEFVGMLGNLGALTNIPATPWNIQL